MNNPAKTPVVLVMQRLHLDDPAGRLSEMGDWAKLELPAQFKTAAEIPIDDDDLFSIKAGEYLHPARYTDAVLEERKVAMGKAAYSAQYLQNPIPDGGGMIDLSEIQRYVEMPPVFDAKVLSVDSATGGDTGCYTAMISARIFEGCLYVTGVQRNRIDIPTQVETIIKAEQSGKYDHIVIEKAHAGIAVIQQLWKHYQFKEEYAFRPNFIEPITPKQSKEVRMEAMLKYVRSGRVLLPQDAPWLTVFEHELSAFPNGKYDDQVDAFSQLILFYEFFMRDPNLRIRRGLNPLSMH